MDLAHSYYNRINKSPMVEINATVSKYQPLMTLIHVRTNEESSWFALYYRVLVATFTVWTINYPKFICRFFWYSPSFHKFFCLFVFSHFSVHFITHFLWACIDPTWIDIYFQIFFLYIQLLFLQNLSQYPYSISETTFSLKQTLDCIKEILVHCRWIASI